jgi:hypothetical protein
VCHQRVEHVAGHVRAPDPAHDPRLPAPPGRDLHEVADALAAAGLVDVDPVPALEERRDGQEPAVLL